MRVSSLLIVVILAFSGVASAASTLDRISRTDNRDTTQIFLTFDRLPEYEQRLSGKRLDVVLHDTTRSENAALFSGDDRIIKALPSFDKGATVLSFFFRYEPQKVTLTPSDENTLVINILPGNKFTKTYRELSSRLEGVTLVDRQVKDYTNPLVASPYAYDWKTFFSDFETPIEINIPVNFYIPSFPTVKLILPDGKDYSDFIPDEALQLADQKAWTDIIPVLEQVLKTTGDIETRKYLALTYGEILLRLGNFEGAYKQLYLLKDSYGNEQAGLLASYLLSILLATNSDPYTADFELRNLQRRIGPGHPLAPHFLISLADTSLATGQIEQLHEVITRDDIAYPDDIEKWRELRQADYYFAIGESVKAYVAYQMISRDVDLTKRPYSLNGLCDTLYEQKVYAESAACYVKLSKMVTNRGSLGSIQFRIGMSQLKSAPETEQALNSFNTVEDTFPGTEAGFRAALKKTDLRFLKDENWLTTAQKYYKALAEKSDYRLVSEEAYFKEALLFHLSGDNSKCIERLMIFQRNFQSGPVRPSAEALLIQILPGELRNLISEKKYIEALALARQNRRFFDNNWIETDILVDLAYAYEQLGIHEEALRLYLYLVGTVSVEEKEKFYLPLTRIAYNKGDYNLVEDFASQYGYNYPEGVYHDEILLLRLKALYGGDQITKAYALIPNPLPDRNDYKQIAATIAFENNKYKEVTDILLPLFKSEDKLPDNLLFILAESLYKQDRTSEAIPYYHLTSSIDQFRDQSLFRLAQISRSNGDESEALKLFGQIVETSENDPWKGFAERELQFKQLSPN